MKKYREIVMMVVAWIAAMMSGAAHSADIGFIAPYDDWRTPIQIAKTTTVDTYYEPISVFTTNDEIEISFGWSGSAAALTPVKFTVYGEDANVVVDWVEAPTAFTTVRDANANGIWSGNCPCGILRFLEPGDYALAATLDPANTLGESAAARGDNTAVFRFAVRDGSLMVSDMVTGFPASDVFVKPGNDFAQEPFAALRRFSDATYGVVENCPMIQFGPYVPMNGKIATSRKKPLDLVVIIDTTGSMSGCIKGLKANLKIFLDSLLKGDAQNDPIDDLRIKLVGFRDDKSDRNTCGWFEETAFSQDATYLKNQLSGFRLDGGGGNGGESSYDALWYVLKEKAPDRMIRQTACIDTPYPFRPKEEAARAIILFTDEPSWCPNGRYNRSKPTTAIGAEGVTAPDIVAAVEEDGVFLTIITDNYLRGWSWGFEQYARLAHSAAYPQWSTGNAATNSEYILTSSLATYASDTAKLRELAASVSKKIPTVVVEPSLIVQSFDAGTLFFKWKNDSAAGTNNIFRFMGYENGNRQNVTTNIECTATSEWNHVELVMGDGDHTFEWTYRKTGYEGGIVDAGLIAGLEWEPAAVKLKVKPSEFEIECEGATSNTVTVTCNTNWTVSADVPWISLSASGKGNGIFDFAVVANPSHNERMGTITVNAGTDEIVSRIVVVRQKASPYVENGNVQILDVGVKPRWPWNSLVDIDFRVILPSAGTPVDISLTGWDAQGEGFVFDQDKYKEKFPIQRTPSHSYIVQNSSKGVDIGLEGEDTAVFSCTSSGLCRITWNLQEWGDDYQGFDSTLDLWGTDNWHFHTPEFKVVLRGSAEVGNTVKTLTVTSTPVRIDTRVGNELGYCRKDEGVIISGTEKIGHPDGSIDPFPWDSLSVDDGRVDLSEAYPEAYRTEFMTNKCLVLNNVQIEGGVITNDTVWMAGIVHVVRDNVYVKNGAKLTIEDGAVVKFCDSTKVFVYWDENSPNTWNVESKGAYITGIYNDDYGGDTDYDGGASTNSFNLAEHFCDQDFPKEVADLNGSGIINVHLRVLDHVTTNENDSTKTYYWKTDRFRTYTRNQSFGNLPRLVDNGEEFFGWFYLDNGDPKSQMDSEGYRSLVESAMVSTDECPLRKGHLAKDYIYALSDIPDETRYPTNYWPKADGGVAEITLESDTFEYDGTAKKPNVVQVKVDDVKVPASNYTVEYIDSSGNPSSAFTDVGVYLAKITFMHDYTNTPMASYVIEPKAVTNAVIEFTPGFYTYSGTKFAKPGVRVRIGQTEVPQSTYMYSFSDGDWTSVGKYRCTAEMRGNYEGTVTADFEIQENPNLAVVLYSDDASMNSRIAAMQNEGCEPRILYLSGRDVPGNAGIATRGIKQLLKENVEVRSFVLTNFVCRTTDWDAEGSNKCATAYAPAFLGGPLPFLGAISVKTQDKCLAWTNGYMSASELLGFLSLAATIPEMSLPALPAGATDADVRAQIAKIPWADTNVAARITSVAQYNKFREWIESLDDATRDILAESKRAYISSKVSEILESPRLFGDLEDIKLEITDFGADPANPGNYKITVSLTAGSPAAELRLKAAKSAFAGKVRLGTTLDNMGMASESDITASSAAGNKVVLSVGLPSGDSGFITIIID